MQNNECIYICEQFTEYNDGSLSTEIKSKVDTHLASCTPCAQRFHALSDMINKLHQLPALKTTTDFNANLMAQVEKLNNESIWQKIYQSSYTRVAGYAIAAGLVVAIGINMIIDPIAPRGPQNIQRFAGEEKGTGAPVESIVEVTDSAFSGGADSLQLENPIIPKGESMHLVSDSK